MADGTPRRVLEYNEANGAITDRLLLILGPENEVAMVKRIYTSYLDDGLECLTKPSSFVRCSRRVHRSFPNVCWPIVPVHDSDISVAAVRLGNLAA